MSLKARLVQYLLERGNLSIEDSMALTGTVLDKLGALPYKEIISLNSEGYLVVNGKNLDLEQARNLRESAMAALDNQALRLVLEQVDFLAVAHGVHKAETPAQMYWGRVGIWWGQNVKKYLLDLAQKESVL